MILPTFFVAGNYAPIPVSLSNYSEIPSGYNLQAIAAQADGKILIAGAVPQSPGLPKMAISRINADFLSVDTGFGDNGTKLVGFTVAGNTLATAIAVQPDGKIVVVGGINLDAIGVVRLRANGQLDDDPVLGFGDGGKATFNWGALTSVNAVKIDRDGGILIAGTTTGGTGPVSSADIFVGRLTPRGLFDQNFGALCPPPACVGPVYIDGANQNDAGLALAVQFDGSILVSGYGQDASHQFFTVTRLTSFGDIDPSFGVFGQARGSYISSGRADSANAIAIGNGGIMIAGQSRESTGANYRFGIAKLHLRQDAIFANSFE